MEYEAQKTNIKLVVLLIPTKELVFQKLALAQNPTRDYLNQTGAEEKVFSTLKEYLSQKNIFTVDSTAALQQEAANGKQVYGKNPDGHLTAQGHLEIARLLAAELDL